MSNYNLKAAKSAKNDEFYTRLSDIEHELQHYRDFFKGKTVLCNCDNPYESNFFKYFAMNFNTLRLKKLITTCYGEKPYKAEIAEVADENGASVEYLLRNKKNTLTLLNGDGDFRSDECVELLKQADVVVTNPPFSLFREYVARLIEYDKKFIIIGNMNAITYKEIFPLIQQDKMWLGYGFKGGNACFHVPVNHKNYAAGVYDSEKGLVKFGNCAWFTNLDTLKRHEELIMYKKYYDNEENYPKYDNYDAINVDKVADIPCDYFEAIGVPITFMDKYNPKQFEIIKFRKGNDEKDLTYTIEQTGRHRITPYFRIIISRRCNGIMGVPITFLDKYNSEQFEILGITQRNDDPYKIKKYTTAEYENANDLNARAVIIQKDGSPKTMYARILIKRRIKHGS